MNKKKLSRSGSLNEESLEKMMSNMENAANDPRIQQQMRQMQKGGKYRR